jgi:hypothetical protein
MTLLPSMRSEVPFVFQMGKVGSTSIARAVDGLQVHTVEPSTWVQSLKGGYHRHHLNSLFFRMVEPKRLITAVREPVGRNLSAFMQNRGEMNWGKEQSAFLANYPHNRPLEWFDREILPATGIDVFAEPFPHEKGWQIISDRLLIIRCEESDSTKETALSTFLGRPVTLGRANVGSEKTYADDYERLKCLPLPPDYIDRMLNSRYAAHFYSQEEREVLRCRWLGLSA